MQTVPIRLKPGDDLRRALEEAVAAKSCNAAFVLSGIGSLSTAKLRFAGGVEASTLDGDLEILSIAGTLSPGASGASHLHATMSMATGQVVGGHVGYGCIVRTTAEVLIALLPEWQFTRELDAKTGYDELVVRPTLR